MTDTVRISVRGVPAPKGSTKSYIYKSKATGKLGVATTADNPKTEPWQRSVQTQIALKWEGPAWEGPIEVTLNFALLRPASVSAKKRPWPCVQPDLDKLERTILDALVRAGAIRDDGQVCRVIKEKRYATTPGVEIELRRLAISQAPTVSTRTGMLY